MIRPASFCSLFDTSNAVVQLVANSGANITPASTTINNSSQITIAVPYTDFVNANEPYGVKVTNPSGLSAVLEPAGTINTFPVWSTGAGSVATIYDSGRSGYPTITLTANSVLVVQIIKGANASRLLSDLSLRARCHFVT